MQGYYLGTGSSLLWLIVVPSLSVLFASFLQRDLTGMMYESHAAFEALSFMLARKRRHSFDISDVAFTDCVSNVCSVQFEKKKSKRFFEDFPILFLLMVCDPIVHCLKQI